jgi:amidase
LVAGVCVFVTPLPLQAVPSDDIARHTDQVEDHLLPPVLTVGQTGALLKDRMAALRVPGVSIAVIHDGRMEWARSYGATKIGGAPVTPDTLFQAASISKPVMAFAVMRLVDQGKLNLDKDVNAYLKSWKVPDNRFTAQHKVTLRELLRHTAGMSVDGFKGYEPGAPLPTLIQVLDGAAPANNPPVRVEATPGSTWRYSGGGYAVVEQVFEDVTGEPFPKTMQDTVLTPAGMSHSTYRLLLRETLLAEAATAYGKDGLALPGGVRVYQGMPALWTTPSDLARFALALQASLAGAPGALLSQKSAREMVKPGLNDWGIGVETGGVREHPYFMHGGSNAGFRAFWVAYDKGDGAVVMTNSDNGDALGADIIHTIAADYGWPDFNPRRRDLVPATEPSAAPYDVTEESIFDLEQDLSRGSVRSEDLVRAYLARIDSIDHAGPSLHSVVAINPQALADARASDTEWRTGKVRGPLQGIPILIKDNIETADSMPTTAGSLALADNVTRRDAPLVARLRAAGAVILGKTNLSEWANIRSSHSISGWSAIGGQTKNPYVLDRGPCGSSAGSAVAVSANLAAFAIGTETNGSLVCPGSLDGIVAFKPTVGLVPRTHVVPISHSQDTAGPMTRTVEEAALVLSIIAGTDPADPATAEADAHKTDYLAALSGASLTGKRLAVVIDSNPVTATETDAVYARAVAALEAAGAAIVKIKPPAITSDAGADERAVLMFELKHDLNDYFASLPTARKVHTLADTIAFDSATPRETVLFGQEFFEDAQSRGDLTDPDYVTRHDRVRAFARATLDGVFADNHADALVAITADPSARIDAVRHDGGGRSAAFFPAVAGYPHLTMPMGSVQGLPVGISFIGPAWSEAKLLQLGYAFEKALPARKIPTYIPSLESTPDIAKAFAPMAR